jgi:hypothetical protein
MKRAIVAWLLVLGGAAGAEESPYLYQRLPTRAPLRVELETGIGTRDARPFGQEGVEQALRVETEIAPWLALAARGGLLFVDGDTHAAAGAEAIVRLLSRGGFELRASGGVVRDYREDVVLRFGGNARLERGRLDLLASGLIEVPLAGDRDVVDLVLGAAAMASVHERVRLGGELLVEDIEGLWEEEEAEGGMRLLAGPAIWLRLAGNLDLKVNLGVTVAQNEAGFLGRLAVGMTF